MRPRGVRVHGRGSCCPRTQAEVDDLHRLFDACDLGLGEPHDLDLLVGVDSGVDEFASIQQVVQFPSVDFVEGNVD